MIKDILILILCALIVLSGFGEMTGWTAARAPRIQKLLGLAQIVLAVATFTLIFTPLGEGK